MEPKRIKQVKECDLKTIAKQSFINCHCFGLHSIMFDDTPGARIRCFYADSSHDMYMNSGIAESRMSVAYHSHHCDVTLLPVFGNVYNVRPVAFERTGVKLLAFEYKSAILNDAGSFVRKPEEDCYAISDLEKMTGPVVMAAHLVHSVYVPFMQEAAWYVFEGKEDAGYRNVSWSNWDLSEFDFSRLYKPMPIERLKTILNKLNVEIIND